MPTYEYRVDSATAKRIKAQNERYRRQVRAQLRALRAEAQEIIESGDPLAQFKLAGIEDECRHICEHAGLEYEYPR